MSSHQKSEDDLLWSNESKPQWFLVEYQGDINTYLNFNESESGKSALLHNFSELPKVYLIAGILMNLFGIVLQYFVIAYERFSMDPMKRGLINQVNKSWSNNFYS